MLSKQITLRLLKLAAIVSFLFLALYGLFTYLLPLLLAGLFSLIIYPMIQWLHVRFRLPYLLSCVICILTLITAGATLIIWLGLELIQGITYLSKSLPFYLQQLLEHLSQVFQNWIRPFLQTWNHYMEALPKQQNLLLEEQFAELSTTLTGYFSAFLEELLNRLMEGAMYLPGSVTIFMFALLCTFFICKDWNRAHTFLTRQFPSSMRLITLLYFQLKGQAFLYIRAQILLLLITFCFIVAGLFIFQVPHAISIALLIAIVDLLPILGTGAVFVPWSLYLFISGNNGLAIGLFCLYLLILLQRQLLEPKIVANALGVYPIISILTIYLGYQMFGLVGIWAGPLLLFVGTACWEIRLFHMIYHYVRYNQFTIDRT
ncbi:sporulation integral membrane protein YtvI [Gracilibacillus alcaliphilus]|uniref:sporulation integral membrane protein YtvI n=1 Tax=Gracilibacillus alcaliphilus TaxID=1401441 RepID=UPI0019594939|nr:sporulation integral membrane protein YtvI [Gracilibacillus alcaliphilus]MBM7676906.1 sporulation integral membrane protein YtvI [Gracilibacillus alcaliphilus]